MEGILDIVDDGSAIIPNGSEPEIANLNSPEQDQNMDTNETSWDFWLEARRQKLEKLKRSTTTSDSPQLSSGSGIALSDLQVDTQFDKSPSVLNEIDAILTPRKRNAFDRAQKRESAKDRSLHLVYHK